MIAVLCAGVLAATACATTADPQEPLPRDEAAAGAPAEVSAPLTSWCAALDVLERKCQRCHASEPEHGAPFALVSYDDTQALNARGKPRYEQIAAAVSSDFMPPQYLKLEPQVESLTEQERTTLLDWCEQGAPGPSGACDGD